MAGVGPSSCAGIKRRVEEYQAVRSNAQACGRTTAPLLAQDTVSGQILFLQQRPSRSCAFSSRIRCDVGDMSGPPL